MNTIQTLGAVILAGGRGKRMNLEGQNKVTMPLREKPIILHIVQFMRHVGIKSIVVVVGHAKESVKQVLSNENVFFAEQKEQLGTGDAVAAALSSIPKDIHDVFVVYGDDGVFYIEKHVPIMKDLFQMHFQTDAAITFLSISQDNPYGLGRIVRDHNDAVQAIVEEKDATDEQKKLREINPGCFVFSVEFLKKYLSQIEKSPTTGEYYLTSLIDLALKNGEKVEAVRGGRLAWRGVNTPEELQLAEKILRENE